MSEKNSTVPSWLDTAVRGIRFGPDRRAVEAELRGHIEDKAADLARIFPDMTPEEAEARALGEMGDPAEIGKELAKIHKPWLGYLWALSQYMLGAAVLASVLCLAVTLMADGLNNRWFSASSDDWWGGVEAAAEEGRAVCLLPPEERAAVDGYTCTIRAAALYQEEKSCMLAFLLRVASPLAWARAEDSPQQHLSAVDSLGNAYRSMYQRFEWDFDLTGERYVVGNTDRWGPFHQDYAMWVEGLDPAAEWVRLEYDWLGRSFQMTIDLKQEAEQ